MNTRINFELAKLLKEKGFKLLPNFESSYPTIAEVVMWLYEKHNIWLYVAMKPKEDGSEEVWFIPNARYIPTKTKNGFEINPVLYMCTKSPKEAYLKGLKYLLKEKL